MIFKGEIIILKHATSREKILRHDTCRLCSPLLCIETPNGAQSVA